MALNEAINIFTGDVELIVPSVAINFMVRFDDASIISLTFEQLSHRTSSPHISIITSFSQTPFS